MRQPSTLGLTKSERSPYTRTEDRYFCARERRGTHTRKAKILVDSLKGLIIQSEEIYGEEETSR